MSDVACARCGSTLTFEECQECGGAGTVMLPDFDFDEDITCPDCGSKGTYPACISSEEFCLANPLPGRAEVARHTPEWFRRPPATPRGAGG
jgi:hypothetical protein